MCVIKKYCTLRVCIIKLFLQRSVYLVMLGNTAKVYSMEGLSSLNLTYYHFSFTFHILSNLRDVYK